MKSLNIIVSAWLCLGRSLLKECVLLTTDVFPLYGIKPLLMYTNKRLSYKVV